MRQGADVAEQMRGEGAIHVLAHRLHGDFHSGQADVVFREASHRREIHFLLVGKRHQRVVAAVQHEERRRLTGDPMQRGRRPEVVRIGRAPVHDIRAQQAVQPLGREPGAAFVGEVVHAVVRDASRERGIHLLEARLQRRIAGGERHHRRQVPAGRPAGHRDEGRIRAIVRAALADPLHRALERHQPEGQQPRELRVFQHENAVTWKLGGQQLRRLLDFCLTAGRPEPAGRQGPWQPHRDARLLRQPAQRVGPRAGHLGAGQVERGDGAVDGTGLLDQDLAVTLDDIGFDFSDVIVDQRLD